MKITAGICVAVAVGLSSASILGATTPAVRVKVYAEHSGDSIVYHYKLINNSQDDVAAVWVGHDNKNDEDNYNDVFELLELPVGWDFDAGIPARYAASPHGWRATVITQHESEVHAVRWAVENDDSPRARSGQTLTGMSVMLHQPDNRYRTSHAFIVFTTTGNRYAPGVTVPLELEDTIPPILSLKVTPSNLSPANGKLVPVAVNVTTKDNYDGQPEIKLESIIANESLSNGDITLADFGRNDREFNLAAKRADDNKIGRIYTITYSATDASGNKATANTTVMVPWGK